MQTISILRLYEVNLLYRRIGVYLDGNFIGNFPKGNSKEIELPAGQHRLVAKTRWGGSKELNFTLFNKENKSFIISTNRFLVRTIAILGLFDAFLLISGRNYQSEHKFILTFKTLAGVTFLMMVVYFLTIGRNNYLIIKEKLISGA